MPADLPILDQIRVASPCQEPWEDMRGDERARLCLRCNQQVYDLSALTRLEAEALVRGTEGSVCLRFFRRADGTVMTADCPVGLARVRRRMRRIAVALAGLVGLGVALSPLARGSRELDGEALPPLLMKIVALFTGQAPPPPVVGLMGKPMMGAHRPPRPQPQPTAHQTP